MTGLGTEPADAGGSSALASVIIPAHNERAVVGRLLDELVGGPVGLEIIVVCNGCTDDTAAVAAAHGPTVRVIELAEASKRAALVRGDTEASVFPRLFVDADVQIDAASVAKLVAALRDPSVLAAAPERVVPRDGVARIVRWYYDVWEQLPQVRGGLFGRGVIALSEAGNTRVRELPPLMGDDLAASEAFSESERMVVGDAVVTVWPPRTVRDLHGRRVRAATGNAQADRIALRAPTSITSPRALLGLIASRPRLALRMPVFVAVTVASRVAARRAIKSDDFDTWRRDESSRR